MLTHPLALRYNDTSVLESHHAATTFAILNSKKCDVLGTLEDSRAAQAFIDENNAALAEADPHAALPTLPPKVPMPSAEDEAERIGALNAYLLGLLAMQRRGALFSGTLLEDFLAEQHVAELTPSAYEPLDEFDAAVMERFSGEGWESLVSHAQLEGSAQQATVEALLEQAAEDATSIMRNNTLALEALAAGLKKRRFLNRAQIDALLKARGLHLQSANLAGLHWLAEYDKEQAMSKPDVSKSALLLDDVDEKQVEELADGALRHLVDGALRELAVQLRK